MGVGVSVIGAAGGSEPSGSSTFGCIAGVGAAGGIKFSDEAVAVIFFFD